MSLPKHHNYPLTALMQLHSSFQAIAAVVAWSTKNPIAIGKGFDRHGQLRNGQASLFHETETTQVVRSCNGFKLASLRHVEKLERRLPVDFFQSQCHK